VKPSRDFWCEATICTFCLRARVAHFSLSPDPELLQEAALSPISSRATRLYRPDRTSEQLQRWTEGLSSHSLGMSPSSTGGSPQSTSTTVTTVPPIPRGFPLPTRDSFSIEVPAPQLGANGAGGGLKSPTALKTQRTPSFSRDGILGAAQKARNMSASSSEHRPSEGNGLKLQVNSDEETINPLKRRNTESGVDYPRRRATIAVRCPALRWICVPRQS
jgi:hypothetical protein